MCFCSASGTRRVHALVCMSLCLSERRWGLSLLYSPGYHPSSALGLRPRPREGDNQGRTLFTNLRNPNSLLPNLLSLYDTLLIISLPRARSAGRWGR